MSWDENFKTRKTIQKLTDENLEQMRRAQFEYTAHYLNRCIESYSDSDIDPLPSALDLAGMLMRNTYDIPLFNIEQLRCQVAHVCCEAPCDLIFAMLFDDDEHLTSYTDRDVPDSWDCINPETWDI